MSLSPQDVLKFWFEDHSKEDWWKSSDEFDEKVRKAFGDDLPKAEAGEFWTWRETHKGRLAEIIMLDQFTRQLHRGSPRAFASDPMAVVLTQEALAAGSFEALEGDHKHFILMPLMHSESLVVHDLAHQYFAALGEEPLAHEIAHRNVIERFGRYPTRNKALGRESTAEEIHYLENEQQGAV